MKAPTQRGLSCCTVEAFCAEAEWELESCQGAWVMLGLRCSAIVRELVSALAARQASSTLQRGAVGAVCGSAVAKAYLECAWRLCICCTRTVPGAVLASGIVKAMGTRIEPHVRYSEVQLWIQCSWVHLWHRPGRLWLECTCNLPDPVPEAVSTLVQLCLACASSVPLLYLRYSEVGARHRPGTVSKAHSAARCMAGTTAVVSVVIAHSLLRGILSLSSGRSHGKPKASRPHPCTA